MFPLTARSGRLRTHEYAVRTRPERGGSWLPGWEHCNTDLGGRLSLTHRCVGARPVGHAPCSLVLARRSTGTRALPATPLHREGKVVLHGSQHVAVGIPGSRDLWRDQPLGDTPGMRSLHQEVGAWVCQVAKGHPRQPHASQLLMEEAIECRRVG